MAETMSKSEDFQAALGDVMEIIPQTDTGSVYLEVVTLSPFHPRVAAIASLAMMLVTFSRLGGRVILVDPPEEAAP